MTNGQPRPGCRVPSPGMGPRLTTRGDPKKGAPSTAHQQSSWAFVIFLVNDKRRQSHHANPVLSLVVSLFDLDQSEIDPHQEFTLKRRHPSFSTHHPLRQMLWRAEETLTRSQAARTPQPTF